MPDELFICRNGFHEIMHTGKINPSATRYVRDDLASRPTEVTLDELYREMTGYGGEEIDWSKPVARVLKNIATNCPNGIRIVP